MTSFRCLDQSQAFCLQLLCARLNYARTDGLSLNHATSSHNVDWPIWMACTVLVVWEVHVDGVVEGEFPPKYM